MSYAVTKSRIFQWLGIILILAVFAGAYWYFKVYGSTLNAPQNDLNTNGLVGLWSFNGDDISGTTAYDRSGNGLNGTLTNGPLKVTGKVGQAVSFVDTDDHMVVADANPLDITGALTMSVWLKTSDTSTCIIAKSNAGPNTDTCFGTSADKVYEIGILSGTLYFQISNGTTTSSVSGSATSITDNQWHLVTTVWDGTTGANGMKIYFDGSLTYQATSAVASIQSTANDLLFSNKNSTYDYTGLMDEARLYNRALTVGEIQSLYTQGGGTKANTSVSQPQGTGRLDSGLAGYWALDENTGTSATDSSTNGNTGTLTNGPTWTTGQIGSAVNFDGTNDYIDFGTAGMTNESVLTLSAWIDPTTAIAATDYVVASNRTAGNAGFSLVITSCSGSDPNIACDLQFTIQGVASYTTTASIIRKAEWQHIAVVYSGSQVSFYRNGSLIQTTSTGSMTTGTNLLLGKYGGASTGYFNGYIDEFRVYKRMLSTDEVGQLYRLTTPTAVDTGLKGYWSFNGADMLSSTTAADRSGAGNTGTLTNGPTKAIGKIGQALSFDGSDDYVDAGDMLAMESQSALTISAWINPAALGNYDGIVSKYASLSSDTTLNLGGTGVGTTSSLVASIRNGSDTYGYTATGKIVTGVWTHCVMVFDGSQTGNDNRLKIYINGANETLTFNGTIPSTTIANSQNLTIGRTGSATDYFDGKIDEVRIYSRALSAAEIKGLYDVGADDKTNSSVSQPQGTGRLDSGLAGYWKLDDGSGTSATDSSTNGSTGTLTSGPTWTTGQIGGAVDFDGTDDYITAGDQSMFEVNPNSISIGGWFKLDALPSGNRMFLVTKGGTTSYYEYELNVNGANSNKIRFTLGAIGGGAYLSTDSITAPTTGVWFHVVGVFDMNALSAKVYYNGVLEGTSTSTSGTIESTKNSNFNIGKRDDSAEAELNGQADEVRVYSRSLSVDEVAQLYRLNAPTGTDTGLKGYWSFNGADMLSSTTVADRSGAGNTGTLTGGPTKAIGKIGQALNFDGTDDYVSVADNAALDFGDTADLTLSGWFYRDTFTTDDTVIAKRNGITAGDTGYIAYIDDATDQLIFEVSDGTDEYSLTSVATFTTTGWNHYAIVWDQDSANNSEIYINGVVNNATDTGTIGNIGDLSNAVVLAAGTESDAGSPFDGKLDEVRIYNRVFTDREIWSLYQLGGGLANTCRSSSVTDADGNVYGTVNIGSQCWMKQNMRVGTRIAVASNQTNNATIEKYCYSNSDANCTGNNPNQPDGGLYQWDEAMQYVTTAGAQGICPAGFHIPTDTEWYVLENHLKDAGQTCSASRGSSACSPAGTKLKPDGVSSFEGNLAGDSFGGSFYDRAFLGLFWSSSESGVNAWLRALDSTTVTISRYADDQTLGVSVRCIQNTP